ncbi:MAG TPA: NADH-quinone oxidoreductase subunit NuoH, partial [Anaerolineae bacterium]
VNDIFIIIALWLRGLLGPGGLNLDPSFVDVLMALIRAAVLGTFALLVFMLLTWVERKVVARMQDRLGPNLAGPWGILQAIADGVKTMTKEDTTPAGADVHVFNAAPIVAGAAAMIVYAVLPFGPNTGQGALVGADLNIGIFYILAVGAVSLIAILMAGWSSNNKYALLGAFRGVAELMSYEVPQVMSVVTIVMLTGTMQMTQIVEAQTVPFLLPLFATALIFLISGVAESGRSPFDLVEAESEIVAGYHIEYSAMKFAMFFLGEYVHAFAVCAVFTAAFLNGWQGPILPPYLWFFIKAMGVFFIMMWFRGTLPRFRIDQLMAFNWKFLVPLSLVNLLMVGIADTLLGKGLGLTSTSNPWAWGLSMFAVNLGVLFIALGIFGRRARRRIELSRITTRLPDEVAPVTAN